MSDPPPAPVPMNRPGMYRRYHQWREPWDLIAIGGGATGVGVAVDAASRGYRVLLLEQSDFGKGTSSRSTKLVHGGVRYLEHGDFSLVMEALKERGLLLQNAPHHVRNLGFVVPSYDWWEAPFYGIGLKLYNLLAGKYKFGPSRVLSREETLHRLPGIRTEGLRGGVIYYDGQFDDSRLLTNLVTTAFEQGATLLNYARVMALLRDTDGFVDGVRFRDMESGEEFEARARVVINATGPFVDGVRQMGDKDLEPMVAASQGAHLVLDSSFLPGGAAIMVPHTSDGRVMFAIPWHSHTLVGTTDTPVPVATLEPVALEQEVDFLLQTAGLYLERKPAREDVLSVFAGIRPLVRSGQPEDTAALSRDHVVRIENSGMVTVCGGKWTTYRRMAADVVDLAATLARLPERPSVTGSLPIHGFHAAAHTFGRLQVYGADAPALRQLGEDEPGLTEPLVESLPYTGAEIVWAARYEMARTLEDVLARRTRALFLNASAAMAMAPRAAELLARELGLDSGWQRRQVEEFRLTVRHYQLS